MWLFLVRAEMWGDGMEWEMVEPFCEGCFEGAWNVKSLDKWAMDDVMMCLKLSHYTGNLRMHDHDVP